MLKHIVMWRLKDAEENATLLKSMLESLPAEIPEIRSLEVGINTIDSDSACDVILLSTFDSAVDYVDNTA